MGISLLRIKEGGKYMKKLLVSFLFIVLIFSGCSKNNKQMQKNSAAGESQIAEENMEDSPLKNTIKDVDEIHRDVKVNYTNIDVKEDLSNITNLQAYYDEIAIPDKVKEHIIKDGFYVDNSYGSEEPFQTYEYNEYLSMSNFVTTDSMVHLYHVFYDNTLRKIEEDKFLPMLKNFNSKMLEYAIKDYTEAKDDTVKEAAKKNLILFETGELIIGDNLIKSDNNLRVDEEIFNLASDEYKNIRSEKSLVSNISGEDFDYSQFKVRGHYTKSENLKKYFQLNMLYSQNKFYIKDENQLNYGNIIGSLLATKNILKDEELSKIYLDVVGTLDFLVEESEKASPVKMAIYYKKYFDKTSDINKLNDKKVLEKIGEDLDKDKLEIAGFKGNYFAIIPQKAPIDNKWAQKLVDVGGNGPSQKPIYKGIEIMALIGNGTAQKLVEEDEDIKKWDKYPKIFQNLRDEVENLPENFYNKNLYRGYFSLMKEFSNTYGNKSPKFMQNENWNKKNLSSALGLWAALKHDTILYSEVVSAEMGGGYDVEICNFVEPNIKLYERLDYLLNFTKENLTDRNLLDDEQLKAFDNFIDLNKFLIECSVSELENSTLSKEANDRLTSIGGEMENIFISFVDPNAKAFWELEDSSQRDMAVVADIMQVPANTWGLKEGDFQEVGLGYSNDMYVVYALNGKLYMGRGPVLTYYEFQSENRLNDDEFRVKLRNNELEQEAFTNSYSFNIYNDLGY